MYIKFKRTIQYLNLLQKKMFFLLFKLSKNKVKETTIRKRKYCVFNLHIIHFQYFLLERFIF